MAVHTFRNGIVLLAVLWASGCSQRLGARPEADPTSPDSKRIHEAAVRFEEKRNQIQVEAARSRWQQGDPDGCIQSLREILSRNPNHVEAMSLLNQVSQTRNSDVELASHEIPAATDQIAQTSNAGVDSSTHLARKALASAEVNVAGRHLNDYVQSAETTQNAAISAALLPLRYEQPELALEIAQSVRSRFGDSAELLRVIGTAHYRHGDYRSSKDALQQSLSLDSTCPLTYLLQSFALEKLGEREAAVQSLQRAHQLGL
ncbi:MAG: tetratricopeptide repeat protein [Pirellulales bacterium]|nr:tetratricopeptide repeat protein [Pirellulales bacterium]